MDMAGALVVVLGSALVIALFWSVQKQEEKARRKRDIDEHIDDGPFFASKCSSQAPRLQTGRTNRPPARGCQGVQAGTSDAFRFCPELFEYRTAVIERLAAEGFEWLSHYSSVDCLHDVYGL